MPELAGISHVGLTVCDMAAAKRFWSQLMGLIVVMEVADFCLCLYPPTMLAIGLKDHEGAATGAFDHLRPGLDHLAFAISDVGELASWADHLAASGVPCSPIQESDQGHHLNLRAPDNIAVELFVIKPEVLAGLAATSS